MRFGCTGINVFCNLFNFIIVKFENVKDHHGKTFYLDIIASKQQW